MKKTTKRLLHAPNHISGGRHTTFILTCFRHYEKYVHAIRRVIQAAPFFNVATVQDGYIRHVSSTKQKGERWLQAQNLLKVKERRDHASPPALQKVSMTKTRTLSCQLETGNPSSSFTGQQAMCARREYAAFFAARLWIETKWMSWLQVLLFFATIPISTTFRRHRAICA